VRVHTVGANIFAAEILTDAVDYRYAEQQGGWADARATHLPEWLARRCLDLTTALELPLAGIDLVISPDGSPVCLEVNPSPAFNYYEALTGQPIGEAVARYLAAE
jgi:glutathione synthase/RimK-type ligase-like ATP-grasp enzyme